MQILEHRVLAVQRLNTNLIFALKSLQLFLGTLALLSLWCFHCSAAKTASALANKQKLRIRVVQIL